ncbi:hypothetical protein Psuf_021720 [Phytohabitans suffuscus]|uniref:Bacterial transcriptional activator domain-containing protein n=1 Tax=Phytohabitans suffuscus TaxID=624315 RepID=A0A6F8YFR8_9ACTN|nr:hypothetical protein Psuf_021720 [Phytohabitans suffuscus]
MTRYRCQQRPGRALLPPNWFHVYEKRGFQCRSATTTRRSALASGDVPAAREHFQYALELARETDHRREIAASLDGIACCLIATEPHRARALWRRALKPLIELDMPERFEVDKRQAEAKRRRLLLGDETRTAHTRPEVSASTSRPIIAPVGTVIIHRGQSRGP